MRCNILIKLYLSGEKYQDNFNQPEIYAIHDCEVPRGSYEHGEPSSWLDASRITIHVFAWAFFDPSKKTLDKFEGTDLASPNDIIVYVMAGTPPEEVEALVTALAETFAVPETADAR